MYIPFIKIYYEDSYLEGLLDIFKSGRFVEGRYTREFERAFAKYLGVKYAVAVNNGSSAEYILLRALGIGHGDKVIVPSFTFISTVSQVIHLGAKPIFADIDPKTYTIDPADVEKKMSHDVKAIIAVHLFGHPADLKPLMEIADKHGVYLIEDSCQAHGAMYRGSKVGGIGYAGFFSFYPTKNMTVYGEGGMVVSNDYDLIERIRILKNHGFRDDNIIELGYNMKFNEIQAYLGLKSLESLDRNNKVRRKIAKLYSDQLRGVLEVPVEKEYAYHVYSLYTIKFRSREKLMDYLIKNGIDVRVYYKTPIHMQPIIRRIVGDVKLPNTEAISKYVLSLPIYPGLKSEEIDYIIKTIRSFVLKESIR